MVEPTKEPNNNKSNFNKYSLNIYNFPAALLGIQKLQDIDPMEQEIPTCPSILALKSSMNRESCRATVHGVTKSGTWLSNRAQHTVYEISESKNLHYIKV